VSDTSICPCDVFIHPTIAYNLPGLGSISYRAGDYIAFRHALLHSLPAETELVNWRPSAQGDLALQMVEWWAYLADILTFYNEQIANGSYLRTADLPEDVQRLIRMLGYRPRPGIGARGVVAALIKGPGPLDLPSGFPIGSKPGPGKQPQTFELDRDVTITMPDAVAVDPMPDAHLLVNGGGVLVEGTVGTVRPGDRVLLLGPRWPANKTDYALATVQSLLPEEDAHGNRNTRVMLVENLSKQLSGALAREYRLLYSTASARVWPYSTKDGVVIRKEGAQTLVDLETLVRNVNEDDPILFKWTSAAVKESLRSMISYKEDVWYANAPDSAKPTEPPDPTKVPPIAILHSRIGIDPGNDATELDKNRSRLLLHFGWQEVGQLFATPVTGATDSLTSLIATPPGLLPNVNDAPLFIEDANDTGVHARGSTVDSTPQLRLTGLPTPPVKLTPPLHALFDLLPVSRGKTVPPETLGSGDAAIPGQEFILQKSPLTYLQSGDSASGEGYTSTLRVWVDGIQWHEVPGFYGQPPNARVFVTREDEQSKTHVMFGDGINGARLPTGINNVVASYRYGSGGEAPAAGSLSVMLESLPNLKAIRNPVAVGGGADPDPPDKIRRYAPRSVLTFGRAVSGDDYEAMAAGAPGVSRARAYWTWDAQEQRSMVKVYVGDDPTAVGSATSALAHADDPNRPLAVMPATPVRIRLRMTLLIDQDRQFENIRAVVIAALLDSDNGLFSASALRIGQSVYRSQLEATCLVPGAVAVHSLEVQTERKGVLREEIGFRYPLEEGEFFQMDAENLHILPGVAGNG